VIPAASTAKFEFDNPPCICALSARLRALVPISYSKSGIAKNQPPRSDESGFVPAIEVADLIPFAATPKHFNSNNVWAW